MLILVSLEWIDTKNVKEVCGIVVKSSQLPEKVQPYLVIVDIKKQIDITNHILTKPVQRIEPKIK